MTLGQWVDEIMERRRDGAPCKPLSALVTEALLAAGIEPTAVPGEPLLKTGGGPRCLSLPLVRA
jgi:N-dimethylarginine dimethylaminohydrolase